MSKSKSKSSASSSRDWASDKYQHVVVQRNLLALISLGALAVAVISVLSVYAMAPLKSVEPYLLTIDEKSGYTQRVEPVSRNQYASNEAIDRYFLSQYLYARETYTSSLLKYNTNVVRTMSTPNVFFKFRPTMDPNVPTSLPAVLKNLGQREIRIRSINYIQNPAVAGSAATTPEKIAQIRFVVADTFSGNALPAENLVATITFEYASLDLNEQEQLLNPLGFTVTAYQVQKEFT